MHTPTFIKTQTKQLQIYSKQHLSSYYTLINYRICDCSRVSRSSTEYICFSALGLVDSPNLLQKSVSRGVFTLCAFIRGKSVLSKKIHVLCIIRANAPVFNHLRNFWLYINKSRSKNDLFALYRFSQVLAIKL